MFHRPNVFSNLYMMYDFCVLVSFVLHVKALKDTEYKGWKTMVLDATFPVDSGPEGLMEALDQICMESSEALRGGQCQVRFCPLFLRELLSFSG